MKKYDYDRKQRERSDLYLIGRIDYDSKHKRKHHIMPNFYLIGRVLGYIILFVVGYFVMITLRLIFGF